MLPDSKDYTVEFDGVDNLAYTYNLMFSIKYVVPLITSHLPYYLLSQS